MIKKTTLSYIQIINILTVETLTAGQTGWHVVEDHFTSYLLLLYGFKKQPFQSFDL